MPRVGGQPIRHRTDNQVIGDGRQGRLIRLLRELFVEQQAVEDHWAEAARLHPSDLRAADLISQHWEQPLTMGELAELLSLSTGAATGTVDRLESAGVVARVPDKVDRRRVHLMLTPEAERGAAGFYGDRIARLRAVLTDFEVREVEVIERFLLAVIPAVGQRVDPAALRAVIDADG